MGIPTGCWIRKWSQMRTAFLPASNCGPAELPVLILPGKQILRNPANSALADQLGLTETLDPATRF